ncbi:DUF4232 domain-containing protein [Streptomyces sp. NBC_01465]|uniref:DUF4232 domain-containing protein n=1 Tax=Streptomyces sp. NBC_01465 TaxID=2903878 RepID=UPI002E30B58E|nr:DUF4232 domain-containing protein [Streptomyces sp. NBC_01465]
MRTYRKNTVLAVAAVAALSLGLTACGGSDSGTKDAGSATASQTATTNDGASKQTSGGTDDTSTGKAADQASSKSKGSTTGGTTGGGTTSTAKTPECQVGALTYSTEHKNAGKQGDHILITATNNTGSSCTLQKFPIITPGAANGDVPHSKKDSQPAQPLTLKAGSHVYAALELFPEGTSDLSFSSIRMSLYMNNVDDSAKLVTLNTGKAYYADSADGIEVYSWNPVKPFDF